MSDDVDSTDDMTGACPLNRNTSITIINKPVRPSVTARTAFVVLANVATPSCSVADAGVCVGFGRTSSRLS